MRKFKNIRILAGLTLLAMINTANAETMTGKVVRIVDGDTVVFLDQSNIQHKVRLAGIDTPERGQPFGKRATENARRLAGNKPARLEWNKTDRYGRIVGKVWVRSPDTPCTEANCPLNLDLNLVQITSGLAWHYKKYAHEQKEEDRERCSFAEIEARARKAGLWADPHAIAPWDWRKMKRKGN